MYNINEPETNQYRASYTGELSLIHKHIFMTAF